MTCKEFENWLRNRGGEDSAEKLPDCCRSHIKTCPACAGLYAIDRAMEKNISGALEPVDLPAGLQEQVDISICHSGKNRPARGWHKPAAFIAGILIILGLASMSNLNSPFRYTTFRELGEDAVARHIKASTAMSFTAEQAGPALLEMSRKLRFNIILPDLQSQGFILLGGRLCMLGKCRIAYLFYEHENRVCSLFIMSPDHLGFDMADGSRFSCDLRGCHTDIWKQNGQIYAMVL